MALLITIKDTEPNGTWTYATISIGDRVVEGKAEYAVTLLSEDERLERHWIGHVQPPRADHPDYRAQLLRRVLDKAFPFVPDTTHSRTPRGPEAVAQD